MRRNQLFALLICALLVSGCERAKTKLDREVDRLCAIDGGVKIYETVTLSAENFGPNGEVFPQYQHLTSKGGGYGPDFIGRSERKILIQGDPKVVRSVVQIIRKRDNKTLGESTNYSREGGDFYSLSPPSVYDCKQYIESKVQLHQIFLKG
jgi:hypothetical protein